MAIQFFFLEQRLTLRNRTKLKSFINAIFKKHKKQLTQLTYIFCSDEYLLVINQSHLQHDYYTDIITFDLSEEKGNVIGEVYISVDRVKENGKTHNASFKEELHRVIFHGALHLCGYKDKTQADSKSMRLAENTNLKMYFSE